DFEKAVLEVEAVEAAAFCSVANHVEGDGCLSVPGIVGETLQGVGEDMNFEIIKAAYPCYLEAVLSEECASRRGGWNVHRHWQENRIRDRASEQPLRQT